MNDIDERACSARSPTVEATTARNRLRSRAPGFATIPKSRFQVAPESAQLSVEAAISEFSESLALCCAAFHLRELCGKLGDDGLR